MQAPSQAHTSSYTLQEYGDYVTRTKLNMKEHKKTFFVVAALFFCAGLTATFFGWTTVAVLLLAISFFYYQGVNQFDLVDDVLETQWHLALFINSHTKYLEERRTDN